LFPYTTLFRSRFVKDNQLIVQPSSSLLHVPVTKKLEEKIDDVILGGLSFADEKLTEVVTLTKGLNEGREAVQTELKQASEELEQLHATYRSNDDVRQAVESLSAEDAKRHLPFKERIKLQNERYNLPLLTTKKIARLQQTPEVRHTSTKWRKGDITDLEYEQFVNDNINRW